MSLGSYQPQFPILGHHHSPLTFAGAAVLAWSLVRTGSVVPAIVAHAAFNIPLPPVLMAASLAIGLILIAVFWRSVRESAIDFGRMLATTREWMFLAGTVVVLLGGAILIRANRTIIPYVLALCITAAVAGLIRRSPFRRNKENIAKSD